MEMSRKFGMLILIPGFGIWAVLRLSFSEAEALNQTVAGESSRESAAFCGSSHEKMTNRYPSCTPQARSFITDRTCQAKKNVAHQARGRLEEGARSMAARGPARKPAAAIMAALSVESARLGKNDSMAHRAASDSKVRRSSLLAATPPDTRTVRTPRCSAAANVRETRSSTTARWKLAIRSRVSALERARN